MADHRWDSPLALSIVVPAFNEAARLPQRGALLSNAVGSGVIDPWTTELIVVDDGSTDGTGRVAEEVLAPTFPRLRILRMNENSGKGAAIRQGAAAAAAPVIAFMDADMSVDPTQIPLLVSAMEGADVAIGSRSLANSDVEAESNLRVVMGRTFNLFANALTNVGLKDTQCGFKAFRTPMARILFHLMVVDRFAFDVEVLSLARRFGLKISEIPVQWREAGNSTVRPLADSLSMAFDLLRVRRRSTWPRIPALVVTADPEQRESSREQILEDAFGTFRKTDPVLPLSDHRALLLLPLCKATQVNGTATRLSRSSDNLMVHKRLVSCSELEAMIPLRWDHTRPVGAPMRNHTGPSWSERRNDPVDLRVMSTLEV